MDPVIFLATLSLLQKGGYILIFLGIAFLGYVITIPAAFAASLGYFNIYSVFLIALFGEIFGDLAFYSFGHIIRIGVLDKFIINLRKDNKIIKNLEKQLKNNFFKTFFLIKTFSPINTIGLTSCGVLKVPIKKFIPLSIIITIPKAILFTLIGYFLGRFFENIFGYINLGSYVILIIFIIGIIFHLINKKIIRKL